MEQLDILGQLQRTTAEIRRTIEMGQANFFEQKEWKRNGKVVLVSIFCLVFK